MVKIAPIDLKTFKAEFIDICLIDDKGDKYDFRNNKYRDLDNRINLKKMANNNVYFNNLILYNFQKKGAVSFYYDDERMDSSIYDKVLCFDKQRNKYFINKDEMDKLDQEYFNIRYLIGYIYSNRINGLDIVDIDNYDNETDLIDILKIIS